MSSSNGSSSNGEYSTPFARCEQAFARCGVRAGVAESHGLLCGMLCAPRSLGVEDWLDEVGVEGTRSEDAERTLAAVMIATHEETARGLDSPEFEFSLMLPDDSQPLAARSGALAEWCQGFLYGLGVAGAADTRALSAEAREVIEDLAEFARLEPEDASDEESETAFAEIVEYVRVGVLLVREEIGRRADGESVH